MACNFNYLFEKEDFCRSQPLTYSANVVITNISKIVPDRVVITTDH